jgi:hypothetical protein
MNPWQIEANLNMAQFHSYDLAFVHPHLPMHLRTISKEFVMLLKNLSTLSLTSSYPNATYATRIEEPHKGRREQMKIFDENNVRICKNYLREKSCINKILR